MTMTAAPMTPARSSNVERAIRIERVASAVNFFNPGVIVIGGDIAHADEHLLAGVREVVYRRSTALATRSIRIARSTLDDRAGVIGAAVMVIEAVLAPDAVDQAIAAAAG